MASFPEMCPVSKEIIASCETGVKGRTTTDTLNITLLRLLVDGVIKTVFHAQAVKRTQKQQH